jgi:hypothetical protein
MKVVAITIKPQDRMHRGIEDVKGIKSAIFLLALGRTLHGARPRVDDQRNDGQGIQSKVSLINLSFIPG